MSTDSNGLVVLAVDDEPHGLADLVYMLEQNANIRRCLSATDVGEALKVLGGCTDPEIAERKQASMFPVDAVFADINMPGLSGIEFARLMTTVQPVPPLVFVTGTADQAINAFEVGAIDYVLKPLKQDRIDQAVQRVCAVHAARATPVPVEASEPNDAEVIPVELGGSTRLVPRSSVRWVEAQGDYARLHTTDGASHLVRIPLAQLETRWDKAGFVRIHRSYLVAFSLITELRMASSGYTVILGDGERELPVSRRHTRELKDRVVRFPKSGWDSA